MTNFSLKDYPPSKAIKTHERWEVRLAEHEFLKWRASLNEFSLFFDGASKGNPGQAGAGGILLNAENVILSSYAWGLGLDSNNKAKALALWKGLKQAQFNNISELMVFRDSKIIIQVLVLKKLSLHLNISRILHKINMIASKFWKIRFFHVLRDLNGQANAEANRVVLLGRSIISVDDRESFCNIP